MTTSASLTNTEIELLSRIRSRRAAFVVGTGVSILSTQDISLAWASLIESGRDYVLAHMAPSEGWEDLVTFNLSNGMKHKNLSSVLHAADMVEEMLKEGTGSHLARWLADRFETLKSTSDDIYEALQQFRLPILTTNYDTLIENALGFSAVSQSNPALFLALANGSQTNLVGHLHGVWTEPGGVIFGTKDYERAKADEGVGTIHRSLYTNNSLVYIGFGQGMYDPNFSAVREWFDSKLGATISTHFRLCIESEFDEFEKANYEGGITNVVYGSNYTDLPEYLSSLASRLAEPTSSFLSVQASREVALTALERRVYDESILLNIATPPGDPRELLYPPVFLPVPHEVFIEGNRRSPGKLKRLAPEDDVSAKGVVLIVGDEQSGVTSALEWLLMKSASVQQSAPLLTSFKNVRISNPRPVEHLVRREASEIGLIPTPQAALPPLLLAIDDFLIDDRCEKRVMQDIAGLDLEWLAIGCRRSHESAIVEALKSIGVEPDIRYIGRMNSRDVRAVVQQFDAHDADVLTTKIVDTITNENLPATPHTVIMLLSILTQEEVFTGTSTAALVNQYVELMMRVEYVSPSKVRLELEDLADILEFFASRLVDIRTAEMPLGDFISLLAEYIEKVGWEFNAQAALDLYISMRVLTIRENRVRFAQPSYLYLFAARCAGHEADVKRTLVADPFFYSEVLTHYAALVRNDRELLELALTLADGAPLTAAPGWAFSRDSLPEIEAPEEVDSPRQASPDELAGPTEGQVESSDSSSATLWDLLETGIDAPEPFALERNLNAGTYLGSIGIIDLAASVIRDLDLVKDRSLKTAALAALLDRIAWSIEVAESDDEYSALAAEFLEHHRTPVGNIDVNLKEFFTRDFPMLLSAGLMLTRLASPKLQLTVESIISQSAEDGNIRRLTLASLLSLLITQGRFAVHVRQAIDAALRTPIIQRVLSSQLEWVIIFGGLDEDTRRALIDCWVDIRMAPIKFRGISHRAAEKGRLMQQIQTARARAAREIVASRMDPDGSALG